jgi:starvation-inducible outer membrane lipoprotein
MKSTISKFFIILSPLCLVACVAIPDSSTKLTYNPEQTSFLEEAEGPEALAWARMHSQQSIEEIKKRSSLCAYCKNYRTG